MKLRPEIVLEKIIHLIVKTPQPQPKQHFVCYYSSAKTNVFFPKDIPALTVSVVIYMTGKLFLQHYSWQVIRNDCSMKVIDFQPLLTHFMKELRLFLYTLYICITV